jgi:hypothetical protein
MNKFHCQFADDKQIAMLVVVSDETGEELVYISDDSIYDVIDNFPQYIDSTMHILESIVLDVIEANIDVQHLPFWLNLDSTDYSALQIECQNR